MGVWGRPNALSFTQADLMRHLSWGPVKVKAEALREDGLAGAFSCGQAP